MGRFFSPQLYRRIALGILNEQSDRSPAATHVDGGDGCLRPVKAEMWRTAVGVLEDVMKTLDRWAEWGPIRAAPAKVEALEKRVSELETLLNGKAPPEYCRMCGSRSARLYNTRIADAKSSLISETWVCANAGCECSDVRTFKASSR